MIKIKKQEFIGKAARIECGKKTYDGIIIDETKNMLALETKAKIIRLIKKNAIITIDGMTIRGAEITKRPEERIKSK